MEYRANTFLDFKDSNEKWQTAYALEVTDTEINLQLDSQSRSLWLPIKSQRLAPFRRYSAAHSASSFSGLWKKTSQNLQDFTDKLQSASSRDSDDPSHITQFFRGELIYRLVNAMEIASECDTPVAHRILKEVFIPAITLVQRWIFKLKSLYPGYYQAQSSPEAYMTDPAVAMAMTFKEMSLCLKMVLGEDAATCHLMQKFDETNFGQSGFSALWRRNPSNFEYITEAFAGFVKLRGGYVVLSLLKDGT